MQSTQSQPDSRTPALHIPSALQFGFSLLAVSLLWNLGLSLVLAGVFQRFTSQYELSNVSFLLMAAGVFLAGFLILPSTFYSLLRLLGRYSPQPTAVNASIVTILAAVSLPAVLLLGYWVSVQPAITWICLPFLHILAVALPVWLLIYLGGRGLALGSPQRAWGVLAAGIGLGPLLIITLELSALATFGLIFFLWLSTQPGLLSELSSLLQELQQTQPTPEMLSRLLAPYLTSMPVMVIVLSFGAVIVPLIEEWIKPIGVWLLIGKRLTPAMGFTAGLLSGAGYALVESLALASNGEAWLLLVAARMGTAVIHIFTTGLSGWALATAWHESRYLRLGGVYLLNVSIHSLWNALTLLVLFTSLPEARTFLPEFSTLERIARLGPYGLASLTLFAFLGLFWMNRHLYRRQIRISTDELV